MVPLAGGLSGRQRLALAVWGIAVLVVLRAVHAALRISTAELALVAVVTVFGSFFGVFRPVWRRLPDAWKQ